MASILLVDDDPLLRTTLAFALEQKGYAVTEAVDGEDALRRFRLAPTDLVITDLVMPNKEGIETIIELRREFPAVGIIAMSGGPAHNAPLYLTVAGRLGAMRTLQKPFNLDRLLAAIRDVLAASAPTAPESSSAAARPSDTETAGAPSELG
jgi:DNA-binding response OmpR family regulator